VGGADKDPEVGEVKVESVNGSVGVVIVSFRLCSVADVDRGEEGVTS
jgi:hypothetical protein